MSLFQVSSGGRKKSGEDSKVEEQLSHQLQEQERREEVRAVQHMSSDDATSHIHIQSLDGGSEHPPTSGRVPSKSKEGICQGSDNSVRTQHVTRSREKQTNSRSCPHSITSHNGSESRPQNDSPDSKPPRDGFHSRPHDGSHSRQHAKPYKGPHSRPEYRSHDPRRDYRNSQQSAGRRQTGGSDLPIGSSGDHRRRDRRRYHHVQDENHQSVHSNQPTNDHHPHRHRDSRPEQEMPIGTGQMVNEGLKEEGKVSERRTVTNSEKASRVEPSTEQLSSREQDSQKCVTSGRNEHRGSSHKTRESGYSKSHLSRGRAEKKRPE